MDLLIALLAFCIIAAIAYWIVREVVAHVPVPAPFGNIIIVVVLLIILVFFLDRFVRPLLGA